MNSAGADGLVSLATPEQAALSSAGSQAANTGSLLPSDPEGARPYVEFAKSAACLAFLLGAEVPLAVTKAVAVGTTKYLLRRAFKRGHARPPPAGPVQET